MGSASRLILARRQFFKGKAVIPGSVQGSVGHHDVDDGRFVAPVDGKDAALAGALAAYGVAVDEPCHLHRVADLFFGCGARDCGAGVRGGYPGVGLWVEASEALA